jgi:dipeptidyl aminopeptidase/acylaminoacyl peptidase
MPSCRVLAVVTVSILTVFVLTILPAPSLAQSAEEASELEETVKAMARIGRAYSPSFSPDGKQVAFVSDLNGVPQVWIVPAEGGYPRLVTALEDPVGGVDWSPDGKWLSFSLAPGGGMNSQIYLVRPDGTGLRMITEGGKINNWMGEWSHDSSVLAFASNRDAPERMDAWVFDVAAGEMRLVAKNPGIGVVAGLSRDGRRATVWRMESRSDANMFLIDLVNHTEHLMTPHEGPASFDGGVFSPDGRLVYIGGNTGGDMVAFGRIEIGADGKPGPIQYLVEREDGEASSFAITDDGKTAALMWNVAGRSELVFVHLDTGKIDRGPKLPAEIAGGMSFSRDGKKLVMSISGSAAPTDIWVMDVASQKLTQITHSPHAGVALDGLVRPELVRFKAHDGLELSGWLYRPPGVRGPAPYVVSFHGGPEGQSRPFFRSDFQALLISGIGVFDPNVRGSAGFGKKFVNLDNGELRYDGIKDIESCVGYLIDKKIADPQRVGIMGGSYGGYMTMAGLAWYPDLFAAGANLFGVVNFETFFANTEPWMAAVSTVEYGDPGTQADLLRDLSPIHRVDQVTAPTIVLHGANDTNVPVVEAEQVVESLEERGVPVEYILFPDEGHGFRKTTNRIRSTTAIVAWFDRYLKGD